VVLKDLGMYEKALELSKESVRILTAALPGGHPNIKMVTEIYNSIIECIEGKDAHEVR
jgi:hypothetical protein